MTEININEITDLRRGAHPEGGDMCVMEAVAWVAGEPWSDHPQCACPVVSAFMRSWNDALPTDEDRTRLLKPLIPKLINSRGDAELEKRRATMAADWLVRTYTPAWLRLAKLDKQAELLEVLPEITDFAKCPSLMPTLDAVRADAAAARAAARAAAGDAAWDTAGAAAWDAAWAAAGAAAWDTAWDAAGAAAWDALKPTTEALQASALDLVHRMLSVGPQEPSQ